jgi:formylglycine-generating enzyme required for sulfatase activity
MTGNDYKLPSEAEWEYAARGADLINKKYSYSGSAALEFYGWYANNSGSKTHPVGGLGGNQKGIFDMCGNVSEWCSDWYDPNYYSRIKPGEIDPQGPENPKAKVYRGGNWTSNEMVCKVYNRASLEPGGKKPFIGFRLAMSDR